ncbi:alpha/beta hydrolase [Streptomyces canus]|uniref:alpha/beta hydrolase n=1 Tax=Streptomyces canus TaxID=58343 RepID=UPI0036B2C0FA
MDCEAPRSQLSSKTAAGLAVSACGALVRPRAIPARQPASGVLLTLNGEGHTSYTTGNPCIQKAVNTYLLHGNPPVNGTKCQ